MAVGPGNIPGLLQLCQLMAWQFHLGPSHDGGMKMHMPSLQNNALHTLPDYIWECVKL